MAEYKTIAPVDYVTGKLNKKDKTVFRQKFARDSHGAVIRAMKKEVYVIRGIHATGRRIQPKARKR